MVFILFKGGNELENLTKNPTFYVKEWQQQKQVGRESQLISYKFFWERQSTIFSTE